MKDTDINTLLPTDIIVSALLDYGSDLVIGITKDFTITLINSSSEKFYHWSLAEIQGKNFLELCQKNNFTSPIQKHFFNQPSMLCFNADSKNALGKECNINWIIYPIAPLDQKVIGALIIGKNIELKKNNIAYYLNGIIDAIPGCLYWKDCEGNYLGCNHLTATLAGLSSPYEVIGKTDSELWGDQASNLLLNDKKVIATGETVLVEEKIKTATGEWMYFTGIKMPLKNENNEIIGLIGNSLDITELKKTQIELKKSIELAEAANKAKTEFLENMRHDIRTPLTGIVGFSEIIKSEATNPSLKEYADNLIASSHALLHLMDEVLEAIHVSSGEIPRVKRKFNLANILKHVIALNKAKAISKRLDLSLQIDERIPKFLIGDDVRIHRIMLELVTNALNFTDKGFVTLIADLAKQEDAKVILKLIVEDSGIGIPKEKQKEIFLQFTRLTPSYKGIYKGAGLGLAVVKHFIDELEGEIYVESTIKKGAKFTCIIPIRASLLEEESGVEHYEEEIEPNEEVEVAFVQEAQQDADPHVIGQKILLVEDNSIAQKAAQGILKQFNCGIDIAPTGREALSLWKQNDYDLIFMDIGLPDIDGYEVTHYIRIHEITKKNHVPIIALTAHVGEENKERCIAAGMNAVLSKPLTKKNCSDILDSFTSSKTKESKAFIPNYASDLPEIEEELFNLNAFSLFDSEEGLKTTGTKVILLEMLQFTIADSLPKDMANLRKAYEAGSWDKCQQIAHKIKGGVVYIGATRLKMACQYFERYWKMGKRDLLDKLYQQVLSIEADTVIAIKNWIN